MQSFIAMLETDPDSLQAVLGMATGFMIEKNQHKARNLLKRVAKMEQKTKGRHHHHHHHHHHFHHCSFP